jgi:hypothetical protein
MVQQLPLEYVRQGCVRLLVQCAQQQGRVVCEFLGGSSWCGDAALSCPAADTVVAWVEPPPGDLLLTKLPSSFQLQDGSRVQIHVDGRPFMKPSLWRQLSHLYEEQMQAAKQVCAQLAGAQEIQQQQQPQPPRPMPQQQQQQQQGGDQRQDEQGRSTAADSDVEMQTAPPLQPSQQQASSGHQHTGTDMQLDEDSVVAPATRMPAWQQQGQQQRLQQQPQQHSGESSADAAAAAAAAAALLPSDPFAVQAMDQHSSWVQERVDEMMHKAVELASDEVEPVHLTAQQKQQLQRDFLAGFEAQLQQQMPPTGGEVEAWVRHKLGLQHTSYEAVSDEEADADDTTLAVDQSRQQQRHQQQQQQPPSRPSRRRQQKQQQEPIRRSPRNGAGSLTPQYAAVFGTPAQQQLARRGGREGSSLAKPTQQQPPTPPAAAPPPRQGRRGAAAT